MICQTFSCSFCFQNHGIDSPDPPSSSSAHVHEAVSTRQVICRVYSLLDNISSLVEAESAFASLIFTFLIDVPSLVCVSKAFDLVHFVQRFSTHPYVSRWSWLDGIERNFFFRADFHACIQQFFFRYFSELFFFFTVSHQIDVISKPLVAKRPCSDGW